MSNVKMYNSYYSHSRQVELINEENSIPPTPQSGDLNAIAQHYQSLLDSGKQSDVTLVVGGKNLRAHKLVLSTRSPVFAAMFDHSETSESMEGRVVIEHVQVDAFEMFLRYLYTGKVEALDRFAPELLVIADRVILYFIELLVLIQNILFPVPNGLSQVTMRAIPVWHSEHRECVSTLGPCRSVPSRGAQDSMCPVHHGQFDQSDHFGWVEGVAFQEERFTGNVV